MKVESSLLKTYNLLTKKSRYLKIFFLLSKKIRLHIFFKTDENLMTCQPLFLVKYITDSRLLLKHTMCCNFTLKVPIVTMTRFEIYFSEKIRPDILSESNVKPIFFEK